jgi:hypothetical protein
VTRSPIAVWRGLVAAVLSAVACHRAPAAPTLPIREVSAGCAGGVTGGGTGVALLPDGALYRWEQQLAQSPERRTLVRTDTALAADVFHRLAAMRFTAIDHTDAGNVTCFVRARTDSGAHEVAWPMGDTHAPSAVRALFDRLRGAVPER